MSFLSYALNVQFMTRLFTSAFERIGQWLYLYWKLSLYFLWSLEIMYKPGIFLKQLFSMFILHTVSWSIQHNYLHRLTSFVLSVSPHHFVVGMVGGAGFWRIIQLLLSERSACQSLVKISKQTKRSHGKPMLFACRTTQVWFAPKNHSFLYSYLLAGVPVGWRGSVKEYFKCRC